jgi:tRNA dimethylallyltransferase
MTDTLPERPCPMLPTVFLVGPTGAGKTRVAVWLAKRINAEIVSADSMSVYRGMDIATAKPSVAQRKEVPHHLIDVVELTDSFSVGLYRKLATAAIQDIGERGKVALVCGGTGLYVRSLLDGLFEGPEADWELRARLRAEAQHKGTEALHARLKTVDPLAAEKVSPNDLRRLVRALEVYEKTHRPISEFQDQWKQNNTPAPPIFGLTMHREALYSRIDERVEEMFRRGLVEETRRLLGRGLRSNRTAMQAIGYKEVIGFLEGEYSLEEAERILKRNTRRYAKRQLTWFRKDDRIVWYIVDDYETGEQLCMTLFEAVQRVIQKPGSPPHPSR